MLSKAATVGLALFAGLFYTNLTLAQSESGGDDGNPKRQSRLIEEVIVTAQKREENLQDVPISIAAFSGEALDARGVVDAKDLQLVTPGLTYGTTSGFSVIFLRGIGTDAFIPSADASVATYVDGVYLPFTHSQAQAFGDVERVEVIKGPQGTLFGRNSTGGAINVVTKQPDQQTAYSLMLEAGSEHARKLRAYANWGLLESLAMNISVIKDTSQSYYDHLNKPLADNDTEGVRAKLRWTPVEALDIAVSGYRMKQEGPDSLLTEQTSPKPVLALLGPQETGEFETAASEPGFLDAETEVYSATAQLFTDWADFKFIGATQDILTHAATDFDASNQEVVYYTARTFAEIDTAEFQILSNENSWGANWLTAIGGLYYIRSESGFEPIGLFVGPALPTNLLDPLLSTLGLGELLTLPDAVELIVNGVLETESYAAFFQGTADIGERLALTLGGRYQEETRTLLRASSNVNAGVDVVQIEDFSGAEAQSSNFSPKVALDFKFFDDDLLYLSWSKGFKSGTYNIVSILEQPDYIEPEEVTTTELGVKTQWGDGQLRVNAAVFRNEIDDLQAQVVSLQSGASVSFETAGQAQIDGVEFDLQWAVSSGFVVFANGTWLDAVYSDYRKGSGYDETTGLFFGEGALTMLPGRDFSGNKIVRSPDFSGNLGFSYTFFMGRNELEFASDAYYSSGFYYTAQNSPRSEQPSFSAVNARLSYFYAPWKLRLTAYGKNINDGEHFLFKYESDFGTSATQAQGANYGLRLQWQY